MTKVVNVRPSSTQAVSPDWTLPPSPFVAMAPLHRGAIVAVVLGAIAAVGLLQNLYPSGIPGLTSVWLALGLNGLLLVLPLVFSQPSFGWFHPLIFPIFLVFLDHFRRFGVYVTGLPWHEALPGWSAASLTQILSQELWLQAAGLAALYGGFFLAPTVRLPQVQFQQPAHLGRKTLLTVGLAAGIFAVYMQTRGGIVSHILSWGAGRNEALAGAFYWQFFIQLGRIACLLWLTLDRRATANPVFWGSTTLAILMTFLSGGSRSSVIYFMLMGLMAWLLREQKIDVVPIVTIMAVGLLAMGILGNLRDSTYSGQIDWSALRGGGGATAQTEQSALRTSLQEISQRSSVNAGVFPILARVPHQVDYLYGSSYLAVLTLPVPRALWSAKPGLIAGRVGETFFGSNFGIPPGPVGEAYWNFGVPGVVLVFSVFGMFQKLLADTFVSYGQQPGAIVPYVLTLFLFSSPTGLMVIAWLMLLVPTLAYMAAIGAIRWGGKPGKLA